MQFAAAGSTLSDPIEAIGAAAAVVRAGHVEPIDLAVLFVSGWTAPEVIQAMAGVACDLGPNTVLVGCTAASVVINGREIEHTPAVSLWTASGVGAVHAVRLEASRTATGVHIGGMPDEDLGGRALLLLSDPFSFPVDPFVSHLAMTQPALTVIGGLASAASVPGGNVLVLGEETYHDGSVGLLLEPGVVRNTVVSQGCRPVGRPFTVTRAEENRIIELAGKAPLAIIREVYAAASLADQQLIQAGLHVGRVIDEHKVDFARGDFLIRGLMGADQQSGAIIVGDQIDVGDTIQFQVRDAASADEDLRELLGPHEADAALVFTCNGRGSYLFGEPDHDAALVEQLTGSTATAGMFCGGEIGPIGGRAFLHGFTASIALFSSGELTTGDMEA